MSYLSATHWLPADGMTPDEAFLLHHGAHKAAWERGKAYTRLYTAHGERAHLTAPWCSFGYVLCGFMPQCLDDWLGTGSQAEYELAAELETCSRCRRIFMDSQKCGNPECPCQRWGAREMAGLRTAGGDAA